MNDPTVHVGARLTLGLALLMFSLVPLCRAHAQSENAADAELELCAAEAKLAAALSSKSMYALRAIGRWCWSLPLGLSRGNGSVPLIRPPTFGRDVRAGGDWSPRTSTKLSLDIRRAVIV
jgi:hypothetical protein